MDKNRITTKINTKRKYRIMEVIKRTIPSEQYPAFKDLISSVLKMPWSRFKQIATSPVTPGTEGSTLYFYHYDLAFLSKMLRTPVRELHSTPKYRIEEIIATKSRPAKIKAELFRSLPYCNQAVRNKWQAMSGDRNGYTADELKTIASILQVPVADLFYRS